MVIQNLPWRVTWGKKVRQEDRFATKTQAEKAAKKLKNRRKKYGGKAYVNVRVGKIN